MSQSGTLLDLESDSRHPTARLDKTVRPGGLGSTRPHVWRRCATDHFHSQGRTDVFLIELGGRRMTSLARPEHWGITLAREPEQLAFYGGDTGLLLGGDRFPEGDVAAVGDFAAWPRTPG